MAKISVLGSGSWGLALALLLHNNGHEVLLWSARPENARKLREKRENPDRLPGVQIPEDIEILTDLERAIKSADVTVLAVASPYIRSTAHKMAPFIRKGQKIVNVAKGIEEKTLKTLSDVIEEEIPEGDVAVLSGPSHAEEVGKGIPTTCVVSARTRVTAEYLQSIFMSPVFRVYTTPDILGVELGGALKNVIALAAGTADGLGYGDNTKAALITRGITEIARLGKKMGAQMETFYGLSGIGDLIVTCASVHSRNRKAGYLIVYDPYAELIHYESKSRGYEDTEEKIERFHGEVNLFQTRWKDFLKKGDPYYSPNLTLDHNDFGLNHLVKVERR